MPYENINGLIELSSESRYKIAIVGVPKAGKSWFAYTAPAPVWAFDFDTRAESLKEFCSRYNRTDVEGKSYWDKDPNTPNAMSDVEVDISMFEYLKQSGKPTPATYVLDSMTYMRAAMEHALVAQNKGLSRSVKIGTSTMNIAQGWDIINGIRAYMDYIVGRLSELGNVIAVFHEADETDKATSTKDAKAYTGMKTVQPVYLATVLSLFNDVFRITLDYSGKRIVQVNPTGAFMASTSMRLDENEEPNLTNMIAKHKKALAQV
jgi:hypothetical protein